MIGTAPYVKLDDHRGEDGRVDWDALGRARTANGERCSECGTGISFPKGYPTTCSSCASLTHGDGEVEHKSKVRCPACGSCWSPEDSDNYELFADGDHTIYCGDCGREFTVTTYVSYSFKSPARLPEEDEAEDADEEGGDD